MLTNIEQIAQWIKVYEQKMERGLFNELTKFRKREWQATYELATQQLEREK